MANFGDYLKKAKDLAGGHSDQVHGALDKAEALINEKTGGKYSDKIAKGEELVEKQLGIPDEQPPAN